MTMIHKDEYAKILDIDHREVYEQFKRITGFEDEQIERWQPSGKGTIRVVLSEDAVNTCIYNRELVFTYWTNKYWKIETVRAYFDLV